MPTMQVIKTTESYWKHSHTVQGGSYCTWNRTLTYLWAIFSVHPVNSQFCSYSMLNTFATQKKSVFTDNALEWSLWSILMINFQVKTTFTPHLDTQLQETGLKLCWTEWLIIANCVAKETSCEGKLNKCWVILFMYLVNTSDVYVKHYSLKFPKLKVLLWSSVALAGNEPDLCVHLCKGAYLLFQCWPSGDWWNKKLIGLTKMNIDKGEG